MRKEREDISVRFLYDTKAGRQLLKIATRPEVSKAGGAFLDSAFSRIFIPHFIKKNCISLKGIEVPPAGFCSFNDFFKRRKKKIKYDEKENHLINPCDGLLSVIKLDRKSVFKIKNTRYNLAGLLRDVKLAKEFEGGYALIYRLTPKHYHRYIFIDNAFIRGNRRIEGKLHSVRPIALAKYPVFIENTREYVVLETENFGKIIQMEVGAIMVGKISNHHLTGRVVRGMEKGFFEFGGSTIIVLVKKGRIKFDGGSIIKFHENKEIQVKQGSPVAMAVNKGN